MEERHLTGGSHLSANQRHGAGLSMKGKGGGGVHCGAMGQPACAAHEREREARLWPRRKGQGSWVVAAGRLRRPSGCGRSS